VLASHLLANPSLGKLQVQTRTSKQSVVLGRTRASKVVDCGVQYRAAQADTRPYIISKLRRYCPRPSRRTFAAELEPWNQTWTRLGRTPNSTISSLALQGSVLRLAHWSHRGISIYRQSSYSGSCPAHFTNCLIEREKSLARSGEVHLY
jgi:hypothetical protein